MTDNISLFLAFAAGILSFLSPCVLPLIPSYLVFLIGDYSEEKEKRLSPVPALLFVLSFSSTFILLGVSASFAGRLILYNQSTLRKLSGLLVVILGLIQTGLIKSPVLFKGAGIKPLTGLNRYLRALLLGVGLALAWTPCVGPILSSILIYAGNSDTVVRGGLLLTAYSTGFVLPFIFVMIFMKKIFPYIRKLFPYFPVIKVISGTLIILLGILIYMDSLSLWG